jgi:hypothetical protein
MPPPLILSRVPGEPAPARDHVPQHWREKQAHRHTPPAPKSKPGNRPVVMLCRKCRIACRTFSRLEAIAGPMRSWIDGTIDLCEGCTAKFQAWLATGPPPFDSARRNRE